MKDAAAYHEIEEMLERLRSRVQAPRVLELHPPEQEQLIRAIERARVQLLSSPEPLLVVVLAGGTGAGKSALINALARAAIAEVGETRPTTTRLRVYHHRDAADGGLPTELAGVATFVPHDRPELYSTVLLDTPDLDSFVTQHRALTRQVLKAAGLILYVFSPEKYLDERTWSVLRDEQRFSTSAAVLNKTDQVSLDELAQITADLRQRFADLGLGDIRIFRTCARVHGPQASGTLPRLAPAVDDMPLLRGFLERELQASDITRLRQEQRQRVVLHLRQQVQHVAPETMLAQLDAMAAETAPDVEAMASRLFSLLGERLAGIEEELVTLATLQQHGRFRGPFRTWLAITDCLRFGLPSLIRRLASSQPQAPGNLEAHLRSPGIMAAIGDLVRDEARRVQDLLYTHGLPVGRWHALITTISAEHLMPEVMAEIETHFHAAAASAAGKRRVIVWLANALGTLFLALCVLGGLYIMSRDLLAGQYVGLPLLGHLLALVTLFFLTLQGCVALLMPATRRLGRGLGQQAMQAVARRMLARWLAAYRSNVAADLADLHEPLAALQTAVSPAAPVTEAAWLAHAQEEAEA